MHSEAAAQRLRDLRESGDSALAPLWIEALPPEEALPELFGRTEPLCRLQRARLLLRAGGAGKARDILESVEALPPGLEAIRAELLAEATSAPAEVEEGRGSESLASRTLAELHALQGDRETAAALYRELLAREPGDEELRERLRELTGARRARPEAALEEWLERVRQWRSVRGV
ncbi:MAG: tetratricopeptide repeat protein [Thermodesulfobacteriota bacterium]